MTTRISFGWLNEASDYQASSFQIRPLADQKEGIKAVLNSDRISGSWLYPILERQHRSPSSKGKAPEIYAPWFSLPITHEIELNRPVHESGLTNFLIAVFGLLKGMRLVPEGWGHFYRTPIAAGTLVDFACSGSAIVALMERALLFSDQNQGSGIERKMFGAIHWYLFGSSYEHDFELFNAQYVVLDTCWRAHCELQGIPSTGRHAERPVKMSTYYGIHLPAWAQTNAQGESYLSRVRNELIHEGLFGGEPISLGGYPGKHENIDYELQMYNVRLILSVLGVKNAYTASPGDGRGRTWIDGADV